jgi:hypothetical protein
VNRVQCTYQATSLVVFSSYHPADLPAPKTAEGTTSTIRLNLSTATQQLQAGRSKRLRTCMTCAPKPPIEPSSTVMSAGCSFASERRRVVSNGLQKRASTTVAETPACRKTVVLLLCQRRNRGARTSSCCMYQRCLLFRAFQQPPSIR